MVYAISAVVAGMATFFWALCKVAASADEAARVAWYRRPQPPDEELDTLLEMAVDDCEEVLGAETILWRQRPRTSIRTRPQGLRAPFGNDTGRTS